MSAEDPLDVVAGSIADGDPVDWDLAESGTPDDDGQASVRALRVVERIADYHRTLHQSTASEPTPLAAGGEGVAAHGKVSPAPWGDLVLLEVAARSGTTGEVWRAWDPWLQREVALKFLHVGDGPTPVGVGDSALLQEARALARVRHPGVVAVHGIAGHGGRVGMWMELLEGSTLAAEIERRGALPPYEVARIGLDLCRALGAVEAAGIVHRDIKPANIVLETNGRVVLTDFGLGRRWEIGDPAWRASGTPIFMSPGALSGEPATPRTDIYALGVTLRWALTGRPPFAARNLDELRVEARTGPSTALSVERPDAPPRLIAAIDRAMAPDPEARFPGASQMAAALESVLEERNGGRAQRRRALLGAALAAAVLALGVAALLMPRWFAQNARPSVARLSVTAPANMKVQPNALDSAISPDGQFLALAATDSSGATRLWLRPLNSLTARPIEGTEHAVQPFWSPDSRHLGFFAEGKLKKVSVAGGSPEILCNAIDPRGATWGKGGMIVFAPLAAGSLCSISAEGGPVTEIAVPDTSRQETALRWPEFLPDGKHFLFVTLPARDGSFDVYASSIDSRARKHVLRSAAAPVCAGKDMLVLASTGRLMAQRFDFRALKPAGRPVSLGPVMSSDASVGQRLASASMTGVLIQPTAALANTRLLWRDRAGKPGASLAIPAGRYEKMTFSPDGRRLLVVARSSATAVDLWVIELAKGLATRLTAKSQLRIGGDPAWSPDGNRVAFSSNRDGPTNIYQKLVSQSADEELLYQSSGQFKEVNAWSPDGRYLLFEQADPVSSWDLWLLPLQGDRTPIPYLRSNFGEVASSISPDGRWVAYASDESGKPQIYVQPFPQPGSKTLVSTEGAGRAFWSREGRELVVLGHDGNVWSVPVVLTPTFKAGVPRLLFKQHSDALWLAATPDLQRFLESVPEEVAPSTISVLLNWPALMPIRK